jgi:CRISPR-associated protein Cmr1
VAFWLLTHLGGIGSRSRRCAGSLVAQLKEGSGANLSFAAPRDVTDLKNQLHDGIIASQAIAKKSMTSLPTTSISAAAFDALASSTCKIWILCDKNKSWSTSDEAMRALGEKLRDYRSSLPLSDREVFGLPLRGNKARRASPLLLRVTRLEEESNVEYVGVAILFKTDSAQPYHLIEAWANRFSGKEDVTF